MDIASKSAGPISHTCEEDSLLSLADLSDTNRENLKQSEHEFRPHTWEQLKEIIGARQFQQLKRYPSQLRRYLGWSSQIKREYGNISNFVCQERLHWPPSNDANNPLKARDNVPFGHPDDYKILRNDWPYAVPTDVTHLVLWMKTPLASTPDGILLQAAQTQVQEFVDACFVSPIRARTGLKNTDDMVLWFKNWSVLQSVGSLEHFHCLVRGADEALLHEWTGDNCSDASILRDRHEA